MASIEDRVRDLLRTHRGDEQWRDQAARIGASTTSRATYEREPVLRRLWDVGNGWLDRPTNTRVHDVYANLRGVDIATALEVELVDEDVLDDAGPHSDFDPLNSVVVASVPFMSIWYSLVCLPGEPAERWPVVQCDPAAGADSVMTVAVNMRHFIHQLMCRDGPHYSVPLVTQPEDVAEAIIRLMHAIFRINIDEATELFAHQRRVRGVGVPTAGSGKLREPYVSQDVLRRLDRLAVIP